MTEVILVKDLARDESLVVSFQELKNIDLRLSLEVVVFILHSNDLIEGQLGGLGGSDALLGGVLLELIE